MEKSAARPVSEEHRKRLHPMTVGIPPHVERLDWENLLEKDTLEERYITIPNNCKAIPACLDYRAYAFSVPPDLDPPLYRQLDRNLRQLGILRHEMLGVAYIDADWGFLIIPPPGFPELKINFYHQTSDRKVEQILLQVSTLMDEITITTEIDQR